MHPFLRKMNAYIRSKHGSVNIFRQARYGIGIVYNYLRYQATISDYFELAFYKKSHEEKLTYITSPQALRFAEFVDSMDSIRKYFSKTEMYKALGDYIHRDQLFTNECTYEQFMEYIKAHPKCIYKPDKDDCGHGVELWSVDANNAEAKYLTAIHAPAVLDELVVQSPVMASLNPSSVNTVRLYSLVIGEECTFFASFLRMGRNGAIVDNLGSGGLLAGIDLNTGTVFTPGADDTGRCFDTHPDTGVSIRSFQIPGWQELLRFTEEAAMHYPMKYVGWDIAVCENGFQIIEANPDPMIHGIQTKFDGGRKKQYEELEKRIRDYRNGIH